MTGRILLKNSLSHQGMFKEPLLVITSKVCLFKFVALLLGNACKLGRNFARQFCLVVQLIGKTMLGEDITSKPCLETNTIAY